MIQMYRIFKCKKWKQKLYFVVSSKTIKIKKNQKPKTKPALSYMLSEFSPNKGPIYHAKKKKATLMAVYRKND